MILEYGIEEIGLYGSYVRDTNKKSYKKSCKRKNIRLRPFMSEKTVIEEVIKKQYE
jgi:hypothetical protein